MGNNGALVIASFLLVLLSQMPFIYGNSEAEAQVYKENGFWKDFFKDFLSAPFDIKIDNALDIPLQVRCYVNKKPEPKIIQPGQSYASRFKMWGVTLSGPTIYCEMKWGPSSLDFTAYNIWKDSFTEVWGLHYMLNATGLYKISKGRISKYILFG